MRKCRMLMARLGMDAHWRGSIVVARALRDAGIEVIYVGNQMPPNIVKTAIQEDVDFIGLSLDLETISSLRPRSSNCCERRIAATSR